MGVCINCDNEALNESDYCATCEEREFKKIRGWLFVPAIGLVLSFLGLIVSINTSVRVLMDHYGELVSGQKTLLVLELVFFVAMFVYSLYVGSLFLRKKRQLPRFYIGFLLLWLAFYALDLLLAHYLLQLPYSYENVKALIRSTVSAAIWIPYFCVSVRVQRTFVR